MIIFIKTYLVLSLLWSILSFYKCRVSYPVPLNNYGNCLKTMIVNFVVFPYALYTAIKNKKV